jgi:MIP family channel proteins
MEQSTKQLVAEFLGTLILILIGGLAVVVTAVSGNNVVIPALAHGLILVSLIYTFGHISGGHFNPAVTVGFLVAGKIEAPRAGLYIVAQFIGAVVGAFLITLVAPSSVFGAYNYGQTTGILTADHVGAAALLEGILTFILVGVIFQSAVFGKAGNFAGLAIGLTLAAAIFAGGNLTGASLNPARTLGPALTAGDFSYVIPYLVGQFAGGALSAFLHTNLLNQD